MSVPNAVSGAGFNLHCGCRVNFCTRQFSSSATYEAWSFDLRRAGLQDATRSVRTDDRSLRTARGSGRAQAALSGAETDALEDFAGRPPERTCAPLAADPALQQADNLVGAFRLQRDREAGS